MGLDSKIKKGLKENFIFIDFIKNSNKNSNTYLKYIKNIDQ